MTDFVTRFAPSPTGYLHLGHAGSALRVWDAAKAVGGTVLLRIEDIDQTRCKLEFEQAIYEDLAWLGLEWPEPARRQSDYFTDYAAVLEGLRARGLIYRCFLTRKEVMEAIDSAPHDRPSAFTSFPLDPGREAEALARNRSFAWRLSLRRARDTLGAEFDTLGYVEMADGGRHFVKADPGLHGDVILARKDTPTSYHLAACHDDAVQGVTHIIRGEDIAASTHVHVLLQKLMGWPTPVYTHHPLLRDERGKRFAKRDQSVTLRALRENGAVLADIYKRVGRL